MEYTLLENLANDENPRNSEYNSTIGKELLEKLNLPTRNKKTFYKGTELLGGYINGKYFSPENMKRIYGIYEQLILKRKYEITERIEKTFNFPFTWLNRCISYAKITDPSREHEINNTYSHRGFGKQQILNN